MRLKALPEFFLARKLRASALVGLFCLAGASAQASDCDCACQTYEQILGSIEVLTEDQLSKLNRCGGVCAMAWTQCEYALADSNSGEGQMVQQQAPQDNDPDQSRITTIKASASARSGNSPR